MNINEVKQYITDQWEERSFYVDVPKDNEVALKLLELDMSWNETQEYLEKNYGRQIRLATISGSGNKTTSYNLITSITGIQYKILYKGLEFSLYCNDDNEVLKMVSWFNGYNTYGGYGSSYDVKLCDTLEELYQLDLVNVKKSKRNAMTHFNKEIRNIKQEYKRVLKYHNDIIHNVKGGKL